MPTQDIANPNHQKVADILKGIGNPTKSDPILSKIDKTIKIDDKDDKKDDQSTPSDDSTSTTSPVTLTQDQKDKLEKYDDLKVDELPTDWKEQLAEKTSLVERLDFAKKFITILGKEQVMVED